MQILGWAGYIKVDGTTYTFLGVPSVSGTTTKQATQKSLTVSFCICGMAHVDDTFDSSLLLKARLS